MPKGRGHKGGVPKRKRKRAKTSNSEVGVSQPLQGSSSSDVSISVSSSPHPSIYAPTTLHTPPFQPDYTSAPYSSPFPPNFAVQPTNPNLFYLKLITGNIRMCQGCRGSLRCADSTIPDPPYNLCIARAEQRPYRDPSGNLVTPTAYKPSHYHVALTYIRAVEPSFLPHA